MTALAPPGAGLVIAHGNRVIVTIGETGRPVAWSPWYHDSFAELAAGRVPVPGKDGYG